jgi:hypothetical protein
MATYSLVKNKKGYSLRASGRQLEFTSLADDNCMWSQKDHVLTCAGNGLEISYRSGEQIQGHDTYLSPGSSRLPSEYLAELRRDGMTILDGLLDSEAIARIKQQCAQRRAHLHADEYPYDGFFWMNGGLHWCVDLVRAVSHPIALWIIQECMQTDAIHFCHEPVITTLKPARDLAKTFPDDGWHADYPYHPGVFPDEHWPAEPFLGVQFNICVDPFRTDNGGTQYLPGSHHKLHWPPAEFNQGGTRLGEGLHKDVEHIQAPAGSAVLYDSRTWHRRCDESNISGKDRIAILNAVTPSWVLPMSDKTPAGIKYKSSDIFNQISEREQQDIDRLCCHATSAPPPGMPLLKRRISREKR